MNIKFYTDEEYSYCEIIYKNITFTGHAKCHEDDYDMKSERTGYSIAEIRANIQKLTWIRDYEILPAYNNFKHFYNCLTNSPKSNKESYEIKRVYKEFKRLEYELRAIRKAIKDEREYVRNYINKKEELYQRLRKGKTN